VTRAALRRARRAVVPLLAVLAAAGCGGGRATPRETFETLRSAADTGDAARLADAYDGDTRAARRAMIREWRALLARGDDPAEVLGRTSLTARDVTEGTLDDAVGRLFILHSPFVRDGAWYRDAKVVAEEQDGPDAAKLQVLGVDGVSCDVWFVREGGRWALDHGRTWRGF
jgi:hypothetical protein